MASGMVSGLLTVFLFCVAASSALAVDYDIVELGPFKGPGGTESKAYDINDAGQVVGYASLQMDNRIYHACLWKNGEMIDLGELGGGLSIAYGINNAGQVVGQSYTAKGDEHAFLWDKGMKDLGTLGGDTSQARSINDSGQIVGHSSTANDEKHAFLFQKGVMVDLGVLKDNHSDAYHINASGQVVGRSGEPRTAFLWKDHTMTDLGFDNAAFSYAKSINNSGWIVGQYRTSGVWMEDHAFLWQDGEVRDLGAGGSASDINDKGQVVGMFVTRDGHYDAFLWEDGVKINLNDALPEGSGWKLQEAYAINNKGQIVGFGIHNGNKVGFLMTPRNSPDAKPLNP